MTKHLISALVLVASLLLALGTSVPGPRFELDIRETDTGLLVAYEGDQDCEGGLVVIEVGEPSPENWYVREIGFLRSGSSVELNFNEFKSGNGNRFVRRDHESPSAVLLCDGPDGGKARSIPLGADDADAR